MRLQLLQHTLPNLITVASDSPLAEYSDIIARFEQALWRSFLKDKGSVSMPYWADRFGNHKAFEAVCRLLSKANWISTRVVSSANWGEVRLIEDNLLRYVTVNELELIRASSKYEIYRLKSATSTVTKLTKLNGKTENTGLVREGFAKAGNTRFSYDTDTMAYYAEAIRLNAVKGMDKVREKYPQMSSDKATYDNVSSGLVGLYMNSPDTEYTLGNNYSDSRGRAISSGLRQVGNPIGYKDFRALLVIPQS